MEKLTFGHISKLFEDLFSLNAITEPCGKKGYESTKKLFQRASLIEDANMNKTESERLKGLIQKINDFCEWAKERNYMSGFTQTAITNFFSVLMEASLYDMPTDRNMMEHLLVYALANAVYQNYLEMQEHFPDEDKFQNLSDTLALFDIFGTDDRYVEDMSPLRGSLSIFLTWVKDKKSVFDFWNKRIDELGKNNDAKTDLGINFQKWFNEKTKPSWNVLKLFLNDKMSLPKDYYKEIDDEIGLSEQNYYKAFKHLLFLSYLLRNLFDSMERQNLILEETRNMIRNGARMYYREFYIVRDKDNNEYSNDFENESKKNLMFRTMFCFLDGNLGKMNLIDYLNRSWYYPEIPILI